MAEIDNTNAQKHGGGAARQALSTGAPFTGLALTHQSEVIAELDAQGVDAIVERNAIRLQTAADLYFEALQKAAQDNDEKKFDGYVGRFGWLTAKTLLAWQQVKQNRKHSKGKLSEVLTAYSQDADKTQQEAPGAKE